ncbi:hypothetical protein TNCT_114501, partial [Trichonephila clavata]
IIKRYTVYECGVETELFSQKEECCICNFKESDMYGQPLSQEILRGWLSLEMTTHSIIYLYVPTKSTVFVKYATRLSLDLVT